MVKPIETSNFELGNFQSLKYVLENKFSFINRFCFNPKMLSSLRSSKFSAFAKLLNKQPPISSLALPPSRNFNYVNTVMPDLEEQGRQAEKTSKWLSHNNKIFPPQGPEEERRPAYICHSKENLKYSPKKMWYIACFVRGMSVDEALRQLQFVNKKGALYVRDTILEAQKLAVETCNVEFKTNLWVAESFCGKGYVIKGVRRHARGRFGEVEYKYCHYYVRLEEGEPPENYYNKPSTDKETLLNNWLQSMRNRRVISSL